MAKWNVRDPENLDPYGAQNHPLPPFVPKEEPEEDVEESKGGEE